MRILISLLALFLFNSVGYALEIPRFFGVYIYENGKYVEVVRQEKPIKEDYNIIQRKDLPGWKDMNTATAFKRDAFIPADLTYFNKEGFLVVQDPELSDFRLYRVPNAGKWKFNETRPMIMTSVKVIGASPFGPDKPASLSGLDGPTEPTEIRLRKAKVGENAFIYLPAEPVEQGFYLIDYKKNGKDIPGYNTFRLIDKSKTINDIRKVDFFKFSLFHQGRVHYTWI